jgi:hypothetical protein
VLAPLQEALLDQDRSALKALVANGYVVLEGTLPPALCATLRSELEAIAAAKAMWNSATYLTNKPPATATNGTDEEEVQCLRNPHIRETSLAFRAAGDHAPTFRAIEADALLSETFTPVFLGGGIDGFEQELRLQLNEGHGGCYGLHTDADSNANTTTTTTDEEENGGSSFRGLTCLFYLCEEWHVGDGGELVLLPWPFSPPLVSVPPRAGTVVIFDPVMTHGVLPSFKRRHCFTLWLRPRCSQKTLENSPLKTPPFPRIPAAFAPLFDRKQRPNVVRFLNTDLWARYLVNKTKLPTYNTPLHFTLVLNTFTL